MKEGKIFIACDGEIDSLLRLRTVPVNVDILSQCRQSRATVDDESAPGHVAGPRAA